MRKILLTILTILLTLVLILCMKNGINIGALQIPGFQRLADINQELTLKIQEADTKKTEYQTSVNKIKADTTDLTKAKKEYLDLITVSTDSEIQSALQIRTYTIEYLWSQVGNHATKEGVVAKMDIGSSSLGDAAYKNLNFTITGSYLGITNFISDLENDSKLQFTIDDFDMKSQQATFVVKDVKILKENTISTSSSTKTTNSTNSNTTANTTSNNTIDKATNQVVDAFAPRVSENQTY